MATNDGNPPTIEVEWLKPGVSCAVLGGEHDLSSADELDRTLTQAVKDSAHLIVDVSQTAFIDSSTIRVLISVKEHADTQGCQFNLLLGSAPIVERVLEITDVLERLNRVRTIEEALAQ